MMSFLIGVALCANAVNAKIYTNPSEWNGVKIPYVNTNARPDLSIPMANVADIAKDVINDIKEIGDIFRSYDKTVIKRDICLKFKQIDISADTFRLFNVAPGHEEDIVNIYIDGACETLSGENETAVEKCKKELAMAPYISDGNWDFDHTYFDNEKKTNPSHVKIWKSKNDDDSSNWLISIAHNTVQIAPDTLIITHSHCGFFSCSETSSIQQVPHDLSGTDVQVLDTFFNSILVRKYLKIWISEKAWNALFSYSY